ncbi:unnamed protein product [Blepharisma stoltei]|uniref:Tubulin-specific chaperone A n=1 Tax=Blepharisma stoltei TaxID=1481888 RepID=A0AAU9K004_9CILI|nr:unnamed protein product [Blepharisma stoltei]
MNSDLKKKLRIKSGVVKRMNREHESYQREVDKDRDRVQKLRDNGASESEIKRQEEVLQETIAMIPYTRRKLNEAIQGLRDFMKENDTNNDLIGSQEWTEASNSLSAASVSV